MWPIKLRRLVVRQLGEVSWLARPSKRQAAASSAGDGMLLHPCTAAWAWQRLELCDCDMPGVSEFLSGPIAALQPCTGAYASTQNHVFR